MEYRASSLRLLAMAALASNRDEGGVLGPLGEHQLAEDSRETNSNHTSEPGMYGAPFFSPSLRVTFFFSLSSTPVIIIFFDFFGFSFLFFSFFSFSSLSFLFSPTLSSYCRYAIPSIICSSRVEILIRLFPPLSSDNWMTYISCVVIRHCASETKVLPP